jgi:hypothetical protein
MKQPARCEWQAESLQAGHHIPADIMLHCAIFLTFNLKRTLRGIIHVSKWQKVHPYVGTGLT